MRRRIAVFLGTRPEGIKLAPVIAALRADPSVEPVVVSTGQHDELLDQVVRIFDIRVDHHLAVMQPDQTLASLTARLLTRIDSVLDAARPALALVQGDTTTVLAAALACFYRAVPVGHVEAGLRTGDLQSPFPEEANRVLASRLATLHFAPTESARRNLLAEGVAPDRVFVTGNTVIDALFMELARQADVAVARAIDRDLAAVLAEAWPEAPIVLITGHRRENFGDGFIGICEAIRLLAARFPAVRFVYPVHLNPNVRGPVMERLAGLPNVYLLAPVDYPAFVRLMRQCRLVLTDSGGVQEEAPAIGKPVLVMRDTTERPEGIEAGTARLVGTEPATIVAAVSELLSDETAYQAMANAQNPYGDGQASDRIVRAIQAHLSGA